MENKNCANAMAPTTGEQKRIVHLAGCKISKASSRSCVCVHRQKLTNRLDEGQNYFCLLCLLKLLIPYSSLKHLNNVPLYYPRPSIMSALQKDFPDTELSKINNYVRDYLKARQLNVNNVHEVYRVLLEIEDHTILAEYLPLVQHSVKVTNVGINVYSFELRADLPPNIRDRIVPEMTEVLLVRCMGNVTISQQNVLEIIQEHSLDESQKILVVAIVEKVSSNRVSFKYGRWVDCNALFNVIFRPHRMPVRYQHYALDLLSNEKDIRRYIFPQKFTTEQSLVNVDLKLFNATIANNCEQLQAVCTIVAGPNLRAPYVIFGPPGTGKTSTIVESMLQLRLRQRGSRILVAAGSNSACDTIALLISEYFERNPSLDMLESGLLRIYSRSAMENGVNATLRKHSNVRNNYYCIPEVEFIHVHGIVVATISVVGKLVAGRVGACNHFTHVFIDEAGAITEPETLVAIMGIKSPHCHVILSGDHKQLGPVLKSNRAAALGLQRSMLERLLGNDCYALDANGNYDKTLQVRLRRNYRSHPEIVRLYNHLYYDNELIAEGNCDISAYTKWKFLPNPNFPIIFHAVHGITEKTDGTPSSCNNMEVSVLLWYVRRLLFDGVNGRRIRQSDIGIITPYRLQSNRISAQLRQRNWLHIEVGSVEQFQGREKSIIIVSMVRSFVGLGFVQNPRRLNVILSRAKSLLILIGNPFTLARNRDLKFIIDECTAQGTLRRKRKPLPPRQTTVENEPVTAITTVAASIATQAVLFRPQVSDDEEILLARIVERIAEEKQRSGGVNTNFIRLTVLEMTLRNRSVPLSALINHPKTIILNEVCKSLCHHQRYMKMQLLSATNTTDQSARNPSTFELDGLADYHFDYNRNNNVHSSKIHKDILKIVEDIEQSDGDSD